MSFGSSNEGTGNGGPPAQGNTMADWLQLAIVLFLGFGMLFLMAGLIFIYPTRQGPQPSEPWQLLTTIIGIFGGALGMQRIHNQNQTPAGGVAQADVVIQSPKADSGIGKNSRPAELVKEASESQHAAELDMRAEPLAPNKEDKPTEDSPL